MLPPVRFRLPRVETTQVRVSTLILSAYRNLAITKNEHLMIHNEKLLNLRPQIIQLRFHIMFTLGGAEPVICINAGGRPWRVKLRAYGAGNMTASAPTLSRTSLLGLLRS
jgi:hypothetical protein